ncbi:MAG TPA: CAP domain-containing protein [Polyangiales bacterium]|nr:CAP domain-containing protein [Polyangiales bacterium]
MFSSLRSGLVPLTLSFLCACGADSGDSERGVGSGGTTVVVGGSGTGTGGSAGSQGAAGALAGSPGTVGVAGRSAAAGSGALPPPGGAAGALPPPNPGAAGSGGRGPVGTPAAGAPAAAGAAAPPVTDPSNCPAPDPMATPESVTALNAINALRVPMGEACVNVNVVIAKAAKAHCDYYVANNKANPMCTSNPHLEVMGCTSFTGVYPWDRMKAAGFTGQGGGEVMYFVADPAKSVATWANSVGHRVSMLDPSTTTVGYGSAMGCDTMDFGPGGRPNTMTVAVYPYDGQTNLPTTFAGNRESPMPPTPPTGWPSASPITIYAVKAMITEHTLMVDGTTTPIEHTWLDPTSPVVAMADRAGYTNNPFMYANKPLTPNTKYRVKVSGTYAGGMLSKEWTFTTGVGNPRGD